MPKIVDVFSFNGELDLLEIRLNILDSYVDEFIICESDETFSGIPKPMYYEENKERYAKWHHKIRHFKMSKPDEELEALCNQSPGVPQDLHWWRREFAQKESIKRTLTHLNDDDLVFLSDADEIWDPEILPIPPGRWKLEQTVYAYYLNNRSSETHPGSSKGWLGTAVMPYSVIKGDTLDNLRSHDQHRAHMLPGVLPNGGWHFTNMGGAEFVKRKLASYSHQEFNHPQIVDDLENKVAKNIDFIGRGFTFTTDETGLPPYILENKDKYRHLFKA